MRKLVGKMGGNEPGVRPGQFSADFRELDFSFSSKVVNTGGALRIRIPAREARFWGLRVGDEILVRAVKVKREGK